MANRSAVKSGNWSDLTIWDGVTGFPTYGDIVDCVGFVVTIDQDINVGELKNSVSGGLFNVANAPLEIAADIRAQFSTCVTIAATGGTVVMNGNIYGPFSGSSAAGVKMYGESVVVVNGNVTGGSGSYTHAISILSGSCTLTVNGNVTGGTGGAANGIDSNNFALQYNLITVNGNVIGGTGSSGASGINIRGYSTLVVNGAAMGSANNVGSGVHSYVTSPGSTTVDLAVGGGGPEAQSNATQFGFGVYGKTNVTRVKAIASGQYGFAPIGGVVLIQPDGAGNSSTMIDGGTGLPITFMEQANSDYPPEGHVRSGVSYRGATMVGTLTVPSPDKVGVGTQVDHAIGTAWLDPADAATSVLTSLVDSGFITVPDPIETIIEVAPSQEQLNAMVASAADAFWSYPNGRTLTMTTNQILNVTAGAKIELTRGDTIAHSITGLGDLTDVVKIWFTAKSKRSLSDSESALQITSTDGLLYVGGAAPASSTDGEIEIADISAGSIVLKVNPSSSSLLEEGSYAYDIQLKYSTGVIHSAPGGILSISLDVTQSIE